MNAGQESFILVQLYSLWDIIVKYAPEILSAVAFALLFLPFHYFLPSYLVVLAGLYYLGEWRYLPVISALGAVLHLEGFVAVALSLPCS